MSLEVRAENSNRRSKSVHTLDSTTNSVFLRKITLGGDDRNVFVSMKDTICIKIYS